MKRKLLLLFQPFCICVLVACAIEDKQEWKQAVEGTYVAQYEQPFSIGFDTLIITKLQRTTGSYQIRRKTGYLRKGNASDNERYHNSENWVAVADKTQPLLHVVPSGRELWFSLDTKELTTGSILYHPLQ